MKPLNNSSDIISSLLAWNLANDGSESKLATARIVERLSLESVSDTELQILGEKLPALNLVPAALAYVDQVLKTASSDTRADLLRALSFGCVGKNHYKALFEASPIVAKPEPHQVLSSFDLLQKYAIAGIEKYYDSRIAELVNLRDAEKSAYQMSAWIVDGKFTERALAWLDDTHIDAISKQLEFESKHAKTIEAFEAAGYLNVAVSPNGVVTCHSESIKFISVEGWTKSSATPNLEAGIMQYRFVSVTPAK